MAEKKRPTVLWLFSSWERLAEDAAATCRRQKVKLFDDVWRMCASAWKGSEWDVLMRKAWDKATSKRGGAIECNSHVLVYHDLSALLNHLGRVVPSTFNLSCTVYFQPSVNHEGPSQIEVTKWCAAWDFPHPWTTGTLHSENYAWGQADWPAIWRG